MWGAQYLDLQLGISVNVSVAKCVLLNSTFERSEYGRLKMFLPYWFVWHVVKNDESGVGC
jgi:hypothetical protein